MTGDAGKLECFLPESTLVIGRRQPRSLEKLEIAVDERVLEAGFHHGSTFFEHLAFQRAIREDRAPEVSVRDGLLAVALGLAAERSAAQRRPVELAELGL